MSNKKRIVLTVLIAAYVIAFVILAIMYYITKAFVFSVIFEAIFNLIEVFVVTMVLSKALKKQVTVSMKKMQFLCGLTLFVDGILDTIRYTISGGTRSIMFLPMWLPVCIMIFMHYLVKDSGAYKKEMRKATCFIGIPLLLLAVYFKIISFMDL